MNSFFARAKALLPCIALGLAAAQSGSAQTTPVIVSNYNSLRAAVAQGGRNTFSSNAVIALSGSAQILEVTNRLVLDGSTFVAGDYLYTNMAVITRSGGAGSMFHVHKGGSLTLLNLSLQNGVSTNAGAISNDAGGTLIISNCVFTGNSATNMTGDNGNDGTENNNNGGNGGAGLSASGGAIVSLGTLKVYYSIFNNNSVTAGNGGNGGNGISVFAFGGNGGNGGNGGSAQGGAIVCSGPTNIFFATDFTGNKCAAGNGGTSGTAASSGFAGNPGSGGIGGSGTGGAILASGPVFMTNCLFSDNSAVAGNTTSFSTAGGPAVGGGLDLAGSTNVAFIVNTTFYQNSCQGGSGGGNSTLNLKPAGNGGSASGGGLASAAALAVLEDCTLATNVLTGGTAGVSSTSQSNGLVGTAVGADLARTSGVLKMAGSLLYGGTNSTVTNSAALNYTTYVTNTQPNDSGGVTDLGYNLSSDTSVALLAALGSIVNTDPVVDTGLSTPGTASVGLSGSAGAPTLAILQGSPAIGVIPGIPGVTFPAFDQAFQPRSTPTTIGAYEYNPLDTNTVGTPPDITLNPTNLIASPGGVVQFEVNTNSGSTDPVGFQWRLNGTNLIDSARVSGAWSNILTISNVSTNDLGSYWVLVGTTTLIPGGVITSPTNTLTVPVPAKIKTQPPKTVTPVPGLPVDLTVTATGSPPLSYQWYLNGKPLTDTNDVTGSADATLSLYPLEADNAGIYFVVVTNQFGSAASSNVTLSIPIPTLTITPQTLIATNPNLTITGTATGNFGVTNVRCQFNANPWTNATFTTSSTWSVPLVLRPGTNTFSAYTTDILGQNSQTKTVSVFYRTTNTLTLVAPNPALGQITRSFSGTNLEAGLNYTLTAVPKPGYLFSNWTGTFTTTSNPLTLLLESNTTLTANFVSNFFVPGIYNGLFSSTNGVTEQTAGMLANLTLNSNGGFSGKLLIAGTNYTLTNSFNILGNASFTVGSPAAPGGRASIPGGPLQVDLTFEKAPANQITGTVSNPNFTANLIADLGDTNQALAHYTLLFETDTTSTNSPPGDGYALVTNHNGTITLGGALADGTPFSQAVTVSATGDIPVYASLYKTTNAGLLWGWINLTNLLAGSSANTLTWIKPSAASTNLYPAGFTNQLSVHGARWTTPPANSPAIYFTNGYLLVSSSSLSLLFDVAVSSNNALVNLGGDATNSLTGSINPATGLFSVTFGNGNGKGTTTATGAALQTSNTAAGFFVTTTNAGAITLLAGISGRAPMIFQQPTGQNFAVNTRFTFSVSADGARPLRWQWLFDGTNVIHDGTNAAWGGIFSGSATSNLSIASSTLKDAGSYSVVVSNPFGSATSSVVSLAVPSPSLAITSPKSNSVTSGLAVTVSGTAAGKFGLSGVQYRINGGGWGPASLSGTNWSVGVTLQDGTNHFSAYAVDPLGNPSPTQSISILYTPQSTLALRVNGYGANKPGFTNKPVSASANGLTYSNLGVGTNYTVTAVPAAGSLFSNWTESYSAATLTLTNNPLTFLMQSNMNLTANFVTNFFVAARGTYNGLFSTPDGVTGQTAGMLYNLVLTTTGAYSGKLLIAGASYPLTNSFNITGQSSPGAGPSNFPGGPLQLDLTLQQGPPFQITGTVSNTNFTASLIANMGDTNQALAHYTLLFETDTTSTNSPPGDGCALMTNHNGTITLGGALADGTPFSQAVTVSATGDIPVYASLYKTTNAGLLWGWINLTNLLAGSSANTLTWIKPSAASTNLYPAGFTNQLPVQGALWTAPPANSPAVAFSKDDLFITNFNLDLDFTVALLNNNTLAKLGGDPANSLTGSIVPATGLLKLSFGNGNGAATTAGMGAVLQNQTNAGQTTAGGFFLTATNAGTILLQPRAAQ